MRCFGVRRELNPTANQAIGLRQAVGACRFAQNALLADVKARINAGEQQSWSSISLHTRWREIRADVAPWYGDVSKEAFQYGAERLSNGLANWSKTRHKKRGGKFGFPGFRRRGHADTVAFTTARLRANGATVLVPRVGDVALKEPFRLGDGQRITAAIVRLIAGRWFITFKVRDGAWIEPVKVPIVTTVGVDLGVGDRLATLSSGVVIANPRFYRTDQARLRRAQKKLFRCQKGSNNRRKQQQRVNVIHYRISCRRQDFLHKFTTALVKNHDEIVIEDLNVASMARALSLGKSVHDAANAEIRRQLEYKATWLGKTVTVVNRWFPSSKTCSTCGAINQRLQLSDRTWECPCGTTHDRDLNAAFNLAASSAVTACRDTVRPELTLAGVDETGRFNRFVLLRTCAES